MRILRPVEHWNSSVRASGLAALCLLLSSCASLELPTVEEAQAAINRSTPHLVRAERAIDAYALRLPSGSDFITRMRLSMFNRLFGALAGNRSDDVRIAVRPTPALFSEKKSTLGIEYENMLNIDTGTVTMNLRTLRIERMERDRIDARLVIEGEGDLSVSGRYLGIPARANPDIRGSLDETISFDAVPSDSGAMVLRPVDKQLTLRLTFTVALLQWRVPWTQDVPIRVSDLIKPMILPSAMRAEFPLPVPSDTPGGDQFVRVPHTLELRRGAVSASRGVLEFRTDVEWKKTLSP